MFGLHGHTAGHEYVGEVVEFGEGVQGFKAGDLVSGEGHITCGKCRHLSSASQEARYYRRASYYVSYHEAPPGSRTSQGLRQTLPSGLDISEIITHHFDIKDYEKGFAAMISGESGKVILDWAHVNGKTGSTG